MAHISLMSVRSKWMVLCRLCSFIKIMSFTSMLVVSPTIVTEDEYAQKYAIKSNVPWPVSIYWVEKCSLLRMSIKINVVVSICFEYWHCCGLFIESIQYSIKAFFLNETSKQRMKMKETYKHWTVFFPLCHFHELNILFTLQCFIAHMLDTTFVTFIIGVFFSLLFFFFHFMLTFQRLTITKTWMNEIKVTISDFIVVQFLC